MKTNKGVRRPVPLRAAVIEQSSGVVLGNLLYLRNLGKVAVKVYDLAVSSKRGLGITFNVGGVIVKLLG